MKKFKLLVAASALCTGLQAQPYTGIETYQHVSPGPTLRLTDGTTTSYNSNGFIMAGHMPSTTGSPIIYIDKTDVDGLFNGSFGEFQNEYKFAADPVKPCGSNVTGASNCYGLTISELQFPTSNEWYVMAAAFDRGCLYSGLDQLGNVVSPAYYVFPLGAVNPSKPIITPSVYFPGKFYITGSYRLNGICHMYIMHIGLGGGLGWSMEYSTTSGRELVPSELIESPYSPASSPEIAVVGTFLNGTAIRREGFFARFKATNGSPLQFSLYGTGPAGTNERFLAMDIASSFAGGSQGYIIGGSSDFNPGAGTSWFIKLDPIGNILWSQVISPSTGITGAVVGVKERFSGFYGQYEYYGTTTDNGATNVFKLDDMGNMFLASPNNEFIYDDNAAINSEPAAITYFDNGGVNDGIHMYSTNTNGVGDYMLTRACFNGVSGNSGCTAITLNSLPASASSPGPLNMINMSLPQAPGLKPCTVFKFGGGPTPVNINISCNEYSFPGGGDQNKSAGATGLKSHSASDQFNVSPNPVTDRLTIRYTSNTGTNVSIGLYNNLGQLVTPAVTPKAMQGTNELELDLNTLNLNSGVYFVTITMNGASTTKKIIYTK